MDNWRWAGVPFLIRTGKRLPIKETELRLVFKQPPRLGFVTAKRRRPAPSQLVVRLDPSTGIRIVLDALRGEQPDAAEIHLDAQFAEEGIEGPTPYEVLLHAALVGDSSHFTRQDMVEESWRIVQPLLDSPPELHSYQQDSWGPAEAEKLAAGFGAWRGPWPAPQTG